MGILPLGALCGHQARDDYPAMTLMGRGCDRQVPGVCAGMIGIGWDFNGADIASMNCDQIRGVYATGHPNESKAKVATAVGQVYRFAHDMGAGETVVMYDPANRLYHLGFIKGPCTPVSDVDGITYMRTVKWAKTASRDVLTPSSKNSLGGIRPSLLRPARF